MADTSSSEQRAASARAHSNIALVKYWGKRDVARNLPATGSISITLADLFTDTRVAFRDDLSADMVRIDDAVDAAASRRVSAFLDIVRARAGLDSAARVISRNNFPADAGLASSASGFAALALAASKAAGLDLSPRELSALARRGSGSAARSIFGGLVEMRRGEAEDGSDAHALGLREDWPLSVVVAITETERKSVASSAGMTSSAQTSPYYSAWVASAEDDLAAMRAAIARRDFRALGEITEHSCLKMHGLMLSNQPGLVYWNAATVAVIHAVRALRERGLPVYFTIDAGPQVKAVCPPESAEAVAAALAEVSGVKAVRLSGTGPGAHAIDPDSLDAF